MAAPKTNTSATTTAPRVVRIITRLNVGGPAHHVAISNGALTARGFNTWLVYGVTDDTEGTLEDIVAAKHLEAVRLPTFRRRISLVGDTRTLASLVRLLYRVKPHVVHTHTSKAGVLGRVAAGIFNVTQPRDGRCVVVHTFHGNVLSGYFGPAASAAARLVERTLARLSDRLVTLSAGQRTEIVERYRIAPASKVVVIPAGLELDALLNVGPPASGPHVRLAYVGRLVAIKDVGTLLRAFASVVAAAPEARLVIAGDGDARPLEALTAELLLTRHVQFVGWTRDLAALYAGVDIGVLSSLNEGTPYSLIEAMAAGRPVVATSVGGVPDIVANGVTGLLVPASNPGAFATAMLDLVRNPERRRRFGDSARASVRDRFNSDRLIDDTVKMYAELGVGRDKRYTEGQKDGRIRAEGSF